MFQKLRDLLFHHNEFFITYNHISLRTKNIYHMQIMQNSKAAS